MLKGEAFVIQCSEKKTYENSDYYFVSLMIGSGLINTTSKIDLSQYIEKRKNFNFSVAQYGKEIKVKVVSLA